MKTRISIRKDWNLIESLIDHNSSILDVGCGEGGLIKQLKNNKHADSRGLEIDGDLVRDAISQGLNVVQGNAESDLHQYSDNSFDYVILSQTLQAMYNPKLVLHELLRIGTKFLTTLSAIFPTSVDTLSQSVLLFLCMVLILA